MGDTPITFTHPLLNNRRPWCEQLLRGRLRLPNVRQDPDRFVMPDLTLRLNPQLRMFLSPIGRQPPMTRKRQIWSFFIQLAKLIKSGDIEIRGMAMNGRQKGCHFTEAHPIGKPRGGCNTLYKAGTEANAKMELRPVLGKPNVTRVYRFWVSYTKPLIHKFKGIIPVTTYGFYAMIGRNWNAEGPMCKRVNLGVFDDADRRCASYERYFGIPLRGSIPQNWVKRYGHLTYVLDYPFRFKKRFTHGFLGVWGMVDRSVYRRMGVPYMTFPSFLPHLVELLSTMNTKRATRINLNKPYNYKTGPWPHIEWLDLHDAWATLILRDGTISVPGIGTLIFNQSKYLQEKQLDRHPRLLAIARAWRKHRKGGPKEDLIRAKALAVEYYRQRTLIKKNVNRIDIRATAKNITIVIYNPAITSLTLPLGKGTIKAEGLSIGKIIIKLPSVTDLRSKKRTLADTHIALEGLTAKKLSFVDGERGLSASAADVRIGRIAFDRTGKLTLSHLDASTWGVALRNNGLRINSGYTYIGRVAAQLRGNAKGIHVTSFHNKAINISSLLLALKLRNSTMSSIRAEANGAARSLIIGRITSDINAGRIGSVKFGRMSIGRGNIGRGKLRSGYVKVSNTSGMLRADIGGLIDLVINKTSGQQLDLNVPGLGVSGTLSNIRIKGPAHFTVTPTSWEISKLAFNNNRQQLLSVSAQLTNGAVTHDPGVRDASLRRSRYRKIFTTRLKFMRANMAITNIDRISFLVGGHPHARRSRFHYLAVQGVALTDIVGSGNAWIKVPPWQYLGARFKKLIGSMRISSVRIQSNGVGRRSRFKDLVIDFKETLGGNHRCYLRLPLLMFSPNQYFIGDPDGKPLTLRCQFNAWLRGGYFRFRSKRRPLTYRRKYHP